jgi:hypothetical protein
MDISGGLLARVDEIGKDRHTDDDIDESNII